MQQPRSLAFTDHVDVQASTPAKTLIYISAQPAQMTFSYRKNKVLICPRPDIETNIEQTDKPTAAALLHLFIYCNAWRL